MSFRTILVGVLALVCGVTASVGVRRLQQPAQQAVAKVDVVLVPVAAIEVKRGDQVTEEMLIDREWPKSMVPTGAVLKREEIVGKLAITPLVKGEPIFPGKVGDNPRFSGMVTDGMRAYTILTPSDASLVAGLIEPGDKVDVLFTDQTLTKELTGGGSTTPLLQNIEVLAIGQIVDPGESREKKNSRDMRSVTLLVPLDFATKLALAQEMGTLHLALRSDNDQVTAKATAVTMTELIRTAYPALYPVKDDAAAGVLPAVADVTLDPPKEIIIRTLRGVAPSSVVMRTSLDRNLGFLADDK